MNVILAIIALLIMVTVHETGHYVAATLSGLTVEEFGIGFGPIIYQKGNLKIRLIPLGAYVMIKELEDVECDCEIPVWSKINTLFWGPLSNLILGVVLFVFVFMIGNLYYPPIVYVPQGTPAYEAGIKTLDKIVAIDDHPIHQFSDITSYMLLNYEPPSPVNVRVERGGNILTFSLVPTLSSDDRYIIGVAMYYPPVVGDVLEDSPAYGKLFKGDVILRIEDTKVSSFNEVYEYIQKTATGDKVAYTFHVLRKNEYVSVGVEIVKEKDFYVLGFVPESPARIERYDLIHALTKGIEKFWSVVILFFRGLWLMLTGRISLRYVAGPVGIVAMMGEALSVKMSILSKLSSFLGMSAVITIALGLTNLLPLPALDGGRLVFAFLSLFGVKISKTVEEKIHMYGFYALLALLIIITFKDILTIVGGGF